jgi:hypothetical protein
MPQGKALRHFSKNGNRFIKTSAIHEKQGHAGPIVFGNGISNTGYLANFRLRPTSGNPKAEIDDELKTVVNMMNRLYYIGRNKGLRQLPMDPLRDL